MNIAGRRGDAKCDAVAIPCFQAKLSVEQYGILSTLLRPLESHMNPHLFLAIWTQKNSGYEWVEMKTGWLEWMSPSTRLLE